MKNVFYNKRTFMTDVIYDKCNKQMFNNNKVNLCQVYDKCIL